MHRRPFNIEIRPLTRASGLMCQMPGCQLDAKHEVEFDIESRLAGFWADPIHIILLACESHAPLIHNTTHLYAVAS